MKKVFKNNIAKYRKKHHLLQAELAKVAGVSLGTIKALETRPPFTTPSVETLVKLAAVLECEPQDLIKAKL